MNVSLKRCLVSYRLYFVKPLRSNLKEKKKKEFINVQLIKQKIEERNFGKLNGYHPLVR